MGYTSGTWSLCAIGLRGNMVSLLSYYGPMVATWQHAWQALEGKYCVVEGKKFHKECFRCHGCHVTLEGGFSIDDGVSHKSYTDE